MILLNLNDGKQTDLILLDFSKAFDKVNHYKLCLKVSHYSIRGTTLKWIEAFLNNRTQQVILNGKHLDLANVLSGVSQGTVLGPLLFLSILTTYPLTSNQLFVYLLMMLTYIES